MKASHGPGAGWHGPDRPGDESPGLNYLLPGIGLVLMLLGFRLLRREEIEACRGAIQVVVSVQEFDQEGGFCRSSDSNPLCITGAGGKLTGEPAG